MSHTEKSKTGRDTLGKIITAGLLVAIAFTALAHGTVEPWSVMLFELIILALLMLWAVKVVVDKKLKLTVPQAALPIAALGAVALAQSVSFTNSAGERWSLSFDVEATRRTLTVLVFLLISFVMAANLFASRRRMATLSGFLVMFGFALAVFALIQHYTWNGKFYWFRPNTVSTSPFGPFVNHNHFAGYMELLIPIPIALAITQAVRGETRLLYGFAASVMGIAAVASLSRGGIISIIASLIFLVVLSARLPKRDHVSSSHDFRNKRGLSLIFARLMSAHPFAVRGAIVLAVAAIIALGMFWLGPDALVERIAKGQPAAQGQQESALFSNRAWVWRDTLTMIQSNPIVGVGLGAYDTAFSIYTKSDGSLRVPQAHNDYLQVIADCGIVGGVIAVWFLIILFRAIGRGIRSRDPLLSGITLGGGAGIFAMLIHSLFDFNLQLPSNALLFLVLVASVSYVAQTVDETEAAQLKASEREVEKAISA